ncbi:MAG: hypothetical protein ACM3UZ_01285 [Acidobacteriota bacterium]
MVIRSVSNTRFKEGDLVSVASLGENLQFCIIGFKENDKGEKTAILKGLFNQTFIIEKPVAELTNLLLRGKL